MYIVYIVSIVLFAILVALGIYKITKKRSSPPTGTSTAPTTPAIPSPAPKASKWQLLDVLGMIFFGLIILGVVVVIVSGAESCMKEYRLITEQQEKFRQQRKISFPSLEEPASTWYNAGNRFLEKEAYEEALQCYSQAIRKRPDFAKAYGNIGIIHERRGNYQQAVLSYLEALRVNPNHVIAWYGIGYCLQNLGRYQEALQAYERFLKGSRFILPEHVSYLADARRKIEGLKTFLQEQRIHRTTACPEDS